MFLSACSLTPESNVRSPESTLDFSVNAAPLVWDLLAPAGGAWESLARESDLGSWGGSQVCERVPVLAYDVSYWDLPGTATSIFAQIVNDEPEESLEVYRSDLLTSYPSLGRVVLEPMARVELPAEIADPVSLAIGYAASLPTVPNGSGSEHGIAVLFDSGNIRMFAPSGSALAASSRPWPTGYEYTGLVAPPSLPVGVTGRAYCDVELLPDGDIVVTFAQSPGVTTPAGVYLREGWIRYNHATSSWEAPVTGYVVGLNFVSFLHPVKEEGFDRSACMSLDTNSFLPYAIVFASNLSWTSGSTYYAKHLWSFALNTSGLFSLNWFRAVPSPSGYGNLQGVAVLDQNTVLVQHDHDISNSPDRVRVFDINTNPVTQLDFSSHNTELNGVIAAPAGYDATCDYWIGFSHWASGPPDSPVVGEECATVYAFEVSACD